MSPPAEKDYVVIVQYDTVKERCSGYFCGKAFNERQGGFADYPADRAYRTLFMTCGGCCGRAVRRKLSHLCRMIAKHEKIAKDRIVVQLSSCITKDNFHALPARISTTSSRSSSGSDSTCARTRRSTRSPKRGGSRASIVDPNDNPFSEGRLE